MRFSLSFLVAFSLSVSVAQSAPLTISEVAEGVFAIVGETTQRSKTNLGNNATFGAIATKEGVVLVDPGGSAKGAAMIEAALRSVTKKPVITVINTGGQDHRWLGNGYFKAKGARIIAAVDAVRDQRERMNNQMTGLEFFIGKEGLEGTEAVFADETFEEALDLNIGGVEIQIRHPGTAHTPGDSFVWLPKSRVVFSGDIVYLERMLGIFAFSNSGSWVEAFKAVAALEPKIVVPGHGAPASLNEAQAQTFDYLVALRTKVRAVLEGGGAIEDGIAVDQSAFAHLANYSTLARRNAQQVYMELEFE